MTSEHYRRKGGRCDNTYGQVSCTPGDVWNTIEVRLSTDHYHKNQITN
jgi:hypothetical protein